MPVGNASDGVGLFAGQIMFSANMNLQHIDWSHDPVAPNHDLDHFGHLNTVLLIPSIKIGLSDYWNINYTQLIGIREMGWGPHVESVHHRTESSLDDFANANGGLFGDGKLKLNPIHGKDLANEVVNAIRQDKKEINIGGPDLLSQNEIAELALKAYKKPTKIIHLPDWIRKLALWSVRAFTSLKTYGPIEFFMTTMVMDMEAPQFGNHKLEDFFNDEATKYIT